MTDRGEAGDESGSEEVDMEVKDGICPGCDQEFGEADQAA